MEFEVFRLLVFGVVARVKLKADNIESAVTPAGTPSAEAVRKAGVACVRRLPAYLQMLRVLQGEGHE